MLSRVENGLYVDLSEVCSVCNITNYEDHPMACELAMRNGDRHCILNITAKAFMADWEEELTPVEMETSKELPNDL